MALAHKDAPALIVTDLMMPAGGGVSVLERLALSAKTSAIPDLVMTGSGDARLERRATDAGALRILKKPVDPVERQGAYSYKNELLSERRSMDLTAPKRPGASDLRRYGELNREINRIDRLLQEQ